MSKRAQKKDADVVLNPSFSFTSKTAIKLMAIIQVVSPLLFFTNLTRNPYYTQIVLLNLAAALCGILWIAECFMKGEWRIPRTPVELPLAVFLVFAFCTSVASWVSHPALRPGILFETSRIWVFTIVNCLVGFYLPILFTKPLSQSTQKISIWIDIVCALIWSGLWLSFHSMKDTDPSVLIWDTYGGILWGLALLYAFVRTKEGEAIQFFHTIFAVSLVAGLYALLQYFGRDVIWGSPVAPYGGRPVSSFGNPNFLSSYLMMVAPIALGFAFKSEAKQAWGYLLVVSVSVLAALSTLTRSTYMGLLAAFICMAIFLFKKENLSFMKKIVVGIVVVVGLVVIFPKTPVTNVQSPLARFTEMVQAVKTKESYGPWHQRILIWSSAWDMVKERPLLGKGWGCFELFYPFYQGKFLFSPRYAQWRTHANNAHNILMEMWSQLGFVGTGLALWLFAVMFLSGRRVLLGQPSESGKMVTAGLLAGLVGMVVDNFFGNVSIFFAMPAFLFWWNAGALYNESPDPKLFYRPLTKPVGPLILFGIFLFLVGGFVYMSARWMQEFYYFQGFKESRVDRVADSVKSLEKAFSWFPGEVNTNYELGNSYARYAKSLSDRKLPDESKKYTEKAAESYLAALKANPGYDEIYFNLGIIQIQLGKKEEGRISLETALLINPLMHNAYTSLGNFYLQTDKPAEARRVYEQAILVIPNEKDFYNNVGFAYTKLGEDEKAFESYKKAIQIDPSFTQAWSNFHNSAIKLKRSDPLMQVPGLIEEMEKNLKNGNYAEAKKSAVKLVELLPDNADSHLSLGNILFYLREKEACYSEFKKAIALKENFAIAHVNLGKAYQVFGDPALAREQFQQALQINPNDAEAKQSLASVHP